MKKIIVIASSILLLGIILYGVYDLFLKRTPEKLLILQFDICLKDFDYTIESFEEQWLPNGDGHVLIVIKFSKLTKENIDYFKKFNPQSLPISETDYRQMSPNKIPKQYLKTSTGFYIYESLNIQDQRNYKLFIVDIEKQIAVLYYQYM